jgi:glycosyltransferase involved in cell wall biosynthesis
VLALGDAAAGPAGAQVRTQPRRGMAARAARALVLPFRARGRVLLTLDPDLLPAARLACARRRRALVADVHEDYVALLADRAWVPAPLRGLLRALAAWCVGLAGGAALTVVADDHVPPADAPRRLVVRNLPDLGMLPANPAPEPSRAVYVGDLRASRGLRTMVEAVAATPGWQLDLVGPVAAADQAWLTERLLKPDVAGRVHLHGRRPPREAWEIAGRASAGLVLLEDTPAFRAAVPTKLYEYLALGLAVVATPLERVVPLVTGSGAGVVAAGADEVAQVLRAWAQDPGALAAHRAAAAAWAAEHLGSTSPYDVLAERVRALAQA